jgi:hypothetical protein
MRSSLQKDIKFISFAGMIKKILIILFHFPILIAAQNEIERKQASFQWIPDSAKLTIDGYGEESWWQKSPVISGFTQESPETARPASQRTEVRVLYDNNALYILAKMQDVQPDGILKELSIRDNLFNANTDIFGIIIDAYQGGNSAMGYFVSPKNIQADIFYTNAGEDRSWDVVWASETRVHENGWTAELKIPYAALRFARRDDQQWNVNFLRRIRRNRETAHWNFINPNIDGFINQFGYTNALKNISPPIRLSINPYLAALTQNNDAQGWEQSLRGGMDIKWGINESYTMDMTLIPDFSNVRTDPQVLNLTPFEIQFQEFRPFFTEGIDLFARGELFYSRRIGDVPIRRREAIQKANASTNLALLENPQVSPLLNATKISGRNHKGLGMGLINGIVNSTEAVYRNYDTGQKERLQTQPLTNYNMIVIDQNLANNSSLALINTNVWRSGSTYDANVTALQTRLRNRKQTYQFSGEGVLSQKYYTDGADIGHKVNVSAGKISGLWRWDAAYSEMSDNYDPNDMGFLLFANDRQIRSSASFNKNRPFGRFVRGSVSLFSTYRELYQPSRFASWETGVNTFILSKNFWGYGLNMRMRPIETRDYFEPRTPDFSEFLPLPANGNVEAFLSSNYARSLAINLRGEYTYWNQEGRYEYYLRCQPRIRFSDRLFMIWSADYRKLFGDQGWVSPETPNLEATLIGTRDQVIISNEVTAKYTFTNRINLDLRLRHYWSQVAYTQFQILDEKSRLERIDYFEDYEIERGVHDINFNTVNVDATLTWRFAPGSDLIFSLNSQLIALEPITYRTYFNQFQNLFDRDQQTRVSLRVLYWLDYQMIQNDSAFL